MLEIMDQPPDGEEIELAESTKKKSKKRNLGLKKLNSASSVGSKSDNGSESDAESDDDGNCIQLIRSCCCIDKKVSNLEGSSYDLAQLYDVFGNLIQDRDFNNNNFLHQTDAIAVINLAKTCSMYEKVNNFLAAGVCYNNIANI
jgi:hypothetical protein